MKFKIIFCGLMLLICVGAFGAQEYCITTTITCKDNYFKLVGAKFTINGDNDDISGSIYKNSCNSDDKFVFSVAVAENTPFELLRVLSDASSNNVGVAFTITPKDTSDNQLNSPASTVSNTPCP